MNIGERIADLLSDFDKTQKDLARELHVAPTTINGYIKGTRQPNLLILTQLADYFHVTTDFLLGIESQNSYVNVAERHLITNYRLLDSNQQELLQNQANLMLTQNHKKQRQSPVNK